MENLGRYKTAKGPCHGLCCCAWPCGPSGRAGCFLICLGGGAEDKLSTCNKASLLGRADTKVCSEMRSQRLRSAAGRLGAAAEGCRAASPWGCCGSIPALHLAVGRGSTCCLADREVAALFLLIWTSCGAPGEQCCSSKPSFAPEANWSGSKGLSGFLSRFPPMFSGINNT